MSNDSSNPKKERKPRARRPEPSKEEMIAAVKERMVEASRDLNELPRELLLVRSSGQQMPLTIEILEDAIADAEDEMQDCTEQLRELELTE